MAIFEINHHDDTCDLLKC